jgi:membrane-associated phospholipid phosphatase
MLGAQERRIAASAKRAAGPSMQRRMVVAGPVVAVISMVWAVLSTDAAGIGVRDPDHVAGRRLLIVVGLVLVLVVADILVRAARRTGRRGPSRAAIGTVWRERWTLGRGFAVATALVSFYVTYLAYRNLKSVVPLLRPGELYDRQLSELDRSMFGGSDPAALMHSLLGSGIPAHLLSGAYLLLFVFIPVTLAFALVFSANLQAGMFYVTAQSLNWLLGAASYFLLPSLGPIYWEPEAFGNLPVSGVTRLQDLLMQQRVDFLSDPAAGGAQSIAAFASLHISIFFTGVLAAHLLGLGRRLQIAAWTLLTLTAASTIYLGWHYVIDDVAGLLLGALAVAVARALTGFDVGPGRRLATARPAPA